MMQRLSRLITRLQSDSGQALVEFALIVIPMVIITLGIIDFARLWMQYQVLTDTARQGARMIVIEDGRDPADKQAEIQTRIEASLAVAGLNTEDAAFSFVDQCPVEGESGTARGVVEVYACGMGTLRGEPARVTIRAPYTFPFLGGLIRLGGEDGLITLSTSSVMRKE